MNILQSQELKEKIITFFNFLIVSSKEKRIIQNDTSLLHKYYGINQKYDLLAGKYAYKWNGAGQYTYTLEKTIVGLNTFYNSFKLFFILNKDTNELTPAIDVVKDGSYLDSSDFVNYGYNTIYDYFSSEHYIEITNHDVFATPREELYYIFNDLLGFDFSSLYRDIINIILPQNSFDEREILSSATYVISDKISLLEFFSLFVNYMISKNYFFSLTTNSSEINKSLTQSITNMFSVYTEPYSSLEVTGDTITILDDSASPELVNNDMVRLSYLNNKILHRNSSIAFSMKNNYQDMIDYDLFDLLGLNTDTFTQMGIAEKINTNLLARNFQSSKAELINLIATYYPEISNDFYNSSVGVMFLDLLAYLHDIQSNYIDRAQRESIFHTMLESNRIHDYVNQFGYPINYGNSAFLKADLIVDKKSINNIVLQKGNILQFGTVSIPQDIEDGVACSVLEDSDLDLSFYLNMKDSDTTNIISKTTNLYDIQMNVPYIEGQINNEEFSALGDDGEKFTLSNSGLSETLYTWHNPVGTADWGLLTVSKYFDYKNNTIDCLYDITKNGNITLKFGNSSLLYSNLSSSMDSAYLGLKLSAGDKIKVISFTNNRANGNGVPQNCFINEKIPFTIKREGEDDIVGDFLIKSNTSSYGGSDIETDGHIKKYFPSWLNNNDRLVSEQDYNSYLNTYSCDFGAIGAGKTLLKQYDKDANLIYTFILLPSSKELVFNQINGLISKYNTDINEYEYNDPLIQTLFSDIDLRKMFTDRVEIHNAFIQRFDFKFDLEIYNSINIETTKNSILTQLYNYFLSNATFQNEIYVSEIQQIVQTELGVGQNRVGRLKDIKIKYTGTNEEYKSLQDFDDDMLIKFDYDKLSTTEISRAESLFPNNPSTNVSKIVMLLPSTIAFDYGFKIPKKIRYDNTNINNTNLALLE